MMYFNPHKIPESIKTSKRSSQILSKSPSHQYISERIFKDKSQLCRIAVPYIFDEPQSYTEKQIKKKEKPTKKIPKYDLPYKNNKPFKPLVNYEKTPINEYLSYELSEEINLGLKEVKIISEQIKHIKEEKKHDVKEIEIKKNQKNIRIRPTKFKHKLFKSVSDTFFR